MDLIHSNTLSDKAMSAKDFGEAGKSRKLSILWASYTLLDASLNKEAILDILRSFSELGHDASLIALRSKAVAPIKDPPKRTIVIPLRCIPLLLPAMYMAVLCILLPLSIIRFKPDFVVLEPDVHILSAFPALLVSKIRRVKLVLDVRSIPVETIGFRGFVQKFWFSLSLNVAKRLFNGITIITPLMKGEVCNQFHIDPAKIGVWTTGVSDGLFDSEKLASDGTDLRKKLGLMEKFVVFHHGVFSPTRGLKETVEAMRLVHSKYPDIVFFLLGSGPAAMQLKAMIQEDNLQDSVFIHGPVEHQFVPKFIAMADVCIVPLPFNVYWRFQCPLKLLEYLSMEKTVIATNLPAHQLVMGNEKCGIYMSSTDPSEVARSIIYAYNNSSKLDDWGKTGRAIIQENYTWLRVAEDLESYLLSI